MIQNRRPKKSEMMPGTLELLILKTLERHREPLHGYGIARHIQRVSDDVLQVEEGSLYPALQRLAVKGRVGHLGQQPARAPLPANAGRPRATRRGGRGFRAPAGGDSAGGAARLKGVFYR
jgi:hypothetical protein